MRAWWIVAAIVVVIAVAIVYWPRDDTLATYRQSNGTMDAPARRALRKINRRTRPRARDRIIRADIYRHNLLGDDDVRRRIPVPQQREIMGAVADDYTAVLAALADEPGGNVDPFDPDFVLHQVLAFDAVYANPQFHANVAATAPAVVARSVEQRRAAAADADTRADAIDTFFNESVQYTSDAQNVHDSGVNADLRAVLGRIRSYERDEPPMSRNDAIAAARKYIRETYDGSDQRREAALRTLDDVARGGNIDTYSDTEDAIFASVWSRSRSDMNRGNRDTASNAVCDALADAVEGDGTVCINGRVSRVLNALATIDPDATIGAGAMTTQTYRNQIFRETQDIISGAIARAATSPDAATAAVGRAFRGDGDAADAGAERSFVDSVKVEIDNNINAYSDRFSPVELARLRTECHAGIEF